MANSFDADMAHQRMATPLTIRPSVPLQSAKRFRKSVHRINEELRTDRERAKRGEWRAKQAKRSATQGKINKQCICMRRNAEAKKTKGKDMRVVERVRVRVSVCQKRTKNC